MQLLLACILQLWKSETTHFQASDSAPQVRICAPCAGTRTRKEGLPEGAATALCTAWHSSYSGFGPSLRSRRISSSCHWRGSICWLLTSLYEAFIGHTFAFHESRLLSQGFNVRGRQVMRLHNLMIAHCKMIELAENDRFDSSSDLLWAIALGQPVTRPVKCRTFRFILPSGVLQIILEGRDSRKAKVLCLYEILRESPFNISKAWAVLQNGCLLDMYARSDITALAKGNSYSRLQWEEVTVGQALALAQQPAQPSQSMGSQAGSHPNPHTQHAHSWSSPA